MSICRMRRGRRGEGVGMEEGGEVSGVGVRMGGGVRDWVGGVIVER